MPLGTFKSAFIGGGGKFEATGGTVTTYGIYTVHTFTSSGTFAVSGGAGNCDMLLVSGGGGSGSHVAGGGGGGGVIRITNRALTPSDYTITVGGGGATATPYPQWSGGARGGTTTAFGESTIGGGGAGSWGAGGSSGANGAGGSAGGGGATGEVTNQFLVIVHFTVGRVVVVEAVMLINIPQVVAEDRQQLVRPRVVTKLVMVVLALGDQVIHPI